MLSKDIKEIHHFVTEIENHLKRHNVQAALDKCQEAKTYIKLCAGTIEGAPELLG